MIEQKDRVVFRKGKRVILRPVCEDDVRRCLIWINDPEVTQFLATNLPLFLEEEKEWLRKRHENKDKDLAFAIETIDGEHIGNVGLHRISWINRHASFGIAIGNKEYWGDGYGTDATMTILEYAFNSLNLHKVSLSVLSSNPRGHKCYLKCGFVDEGCRKEQHFSNGQWVDEIMMSCFREGWEATWQKYQES